MKIVLRILFFPFLACIMLITAIYGMFRIYFKVMYRIAKNGGEVIVYTDKLNPKTIQEQLEKLTNAKS